jgi:DNA polymerase III subunit epsilon
MPYLDSKLIDNDKLIAAMWAKKLLNGEYGDWCILDTETTGLHSPEVVDICIISKYRSPMINTHLNPITNITEGATYIHGLTKDKLLDFPTFKDVRDRIQEITKDRLVIIYNAGFDCEAIYNSVKIHQLPRITFKSECAMNQYAKFYGDWSGYWGNYKWQKLPGGDHTAYGDCLAVHDLLQSMAAYVDQINRPIAPKPRLFPPVQIACSWIERYRLRVERTVPNKWRERVGEFKIKFPYFHLITDKDMEE